MTRGGEGSHCDNSLRTVARAGMLRAQRGWVKGRDRPGARTLEAWTQNCPDFDRPVTPALPVLTNTPADVR